MKKRSLITLAVAWAGAANCGGSFGPAFATANVIVTHKGTDRKNIIYLKKRGVGYE